MSFLAPYMLLGGLAAGIPIALHFFYRSRYRNVPWAAMKFLLAAIEQTSRRMKFQELLLLILRVTLLLLLALALARPTVRTAGASGRGDAVDAVFVLDRSMSMTARAGVAPNGDDVYSASLRQFATQDAGVSRFDRARAAATAVLASLPSGSTVQVIAADDRAALLGPRSPSHLDQAKTLLEQMTPTACGTDLEPAISAAAILLESGPSPGKELYVFSDLQRVGFDANATKLHDTLLSLRDKVAVTFVRCGDAIGNVALTSITPQTTLRSGERADFAVLVRNTSSQAVRNLTVSLEIDGKEKDRDSQPLPQINPGETRAVVLSGVLDRPGRHVLTASVKSDDLPGDNRLDQIIRVNDQVGVLLVDGSPNRDARLSGAYFLTRALNPSGQAGLVITPGTPEHVAPRDLGGKEICILVNVRLENAGKGEGGALSPEFVRALSAFVQDGRGLVIFPGERVEPEQYNRLLFEQQRLLPYRIAKVESTPEDRPWLLDRTSAQAGPFARFREELGYATLDRIESRRRLLIEPPKEDEEKLLAEESRVLLRYRDGKPAVAGRKRVGQGEVILFTSSVQDDNWSDWFISPAFVPVVQVTLNHLLESRPETLNRVAGERLEWQVGKDEQETNFDLVRPDLTRQRLGFPASVGGRALLTSTDLTRAGVYHVVPATGEVDATSPLFAVAPDVRETDDLQSLSPAQIDERAGFEARHLTAGDDGTAFTGAGRSRTEWTGWLLAVLLVLVLGEMALAWWCGRAW